MFFDLETRSQNSRPISSEQHYMNHYFWAWSMWSNQIWNFPVMIFGLFSILGRNNAIEQGYSTGGLRARTGQSTHKW